MSGEKWPYISVIITAYNRESFLLNAIKSAVNQTINKRHYEIIVIKNFKENTVDEMIYRGNEIVPEFSFQVFKEKMLRYYGKIL